MPVSRLWKKLYRKWKLHDPDRTPGSAKRRQNGSNSPTKAKKLAPIPEEEKIKKVPLAAAPVSAFTPYKSESPPTIKIDSQSKIQLPLGELEQSLTPQHGSGSLSLTPMASILSKSPTPRGGFYPQMVVSPNAMVGLSPVHCHSVVYQVPYGVAAGMAIGSPVHAAIYPICSPASNVQQAARGYTDFSAALNAHANSSPQQQMVVPGQQFFFGPGMEAVSPMQFACYAAKK